MSSTFINDMGKETKANFLSYLGGNSTPIMVMVYPCNFENKDAILAYLDANTMGRKQMIK